MTFFICFFMFYLTSYTLYLLSEIFEVATNLKFFVGYVCYSLFLYLARPGVVNIRWHCQGNVSPKRMKLNSVTLTFSRMHITCMSNSRKTPTAFLLSLAAVCVEQYIAFSEFLDEGNGWYLRFSSYSLSNTGEALFPYVSRRLIFGIHNRDFILPWIAFGDHVPSRWTVWQCIREELEICPKGHKQM